LCPIHWANISRKKLHSSLKILPKRRNYDESGHTVISATTRLQSNVASYFRSCYICSKSFVRKVLFEKFCSKSFVRKVLFKKFCSKCFEQNVLFEMFCWKCFERNVLFKMICSKRFVQYALFVIFCKKCIVRNNFFEDF
jgi:hypothetical protein